MFRFGQIPGYTQEGRRQAASILGLLHDIRHILAVGPPRSDITPVKPGTVSRTVSISRRIESSDLLCIIRPSCSVIEQKVHPPKTSSLNRDGEANHLISWDFGIAIHWVRAPSEG